MARLRPEVGFNSARYSEETKNGPRKRCFAEFFGTFWLVFGGCGSAVLAAAFPGFGIGFVGVALAFGLTVLTMVFAIGHISGCHLNPAVTAGLVAGKRFPAKEFAPYALAQVVGAIAAATLYVVPSSSAREIISQTGTSNYSGGFMKSLALLAVLSLATFGLWAQDAPQKPATAPPPPMHHGAHAGMMDMHQHMMQTQDQVTKMRASLEKMKANLSKITDPALKAHAQLDADLWEQMVQHMEGMSKMMSGHGGMGMGGMGMGMKDHPPMPDAKPAAPAEDKK